MERIEVYKVVLKRDVETWTSFARDEWQVIYRLGKKAEPTYPKSMLFAFKDLESARRFAWIGSVVLRGYSSEVHQVFREVPVLQCSFKSLWNGYAEGILARTPYGAVLVPDFTPVEVVK